MNVAPLIAIGLALSAGLWSCRTVMTALYGWPPALEGTLGGRAAQAIPLFASLLIPAGAVLVLAMLLLALPLKFLHRWSAVEWIRYALYWGKGLPEE